MCTYHGAHVDIRGLFSGLVSLLPWVLQIKLKSSGLAASGFTPGSLFWPPLLRLLGYILSFISVPIFVLLSRPLNFFEATKYLALPERVALGW